MNSKIEIEYCSKCHKQSRWQGILRSVINGRIVNQKWNTDEEAGGPDGNDKLHDALRRQNHLVTQRTSYRDVTIKRNEGKVKNSTVHEGNS